MTPEEFLDLLDVSQQRAKGASLEPALRQMVPAIHKGFEDNFMRAEGPGGVTWPPHSPYTIAKMGPHPLLIWHGPLIEATRDTGNPGNITRVTGREIETGVSADVVPYAPTHQYGSEGPPPIPPRPYLYATQEVVDQCAQILAEHAEPIVFGN